MKHRPVHALVTWSGGIDSTALIAQMLANDFTVSIVTLGIYGGRFGEREAAARNELWTILQNGGHLEIAEQRNADFLWAFSPDGVEIPNRNKRILDYMATRAQARGIKHIGMGEYIGADTWVVRDHVAAADADARSLAAYLYQEYGLDYRLWTLADFGESRYKSDRLKLGAEIIGALGMSQTTNCLLDLSSAIHCGRCYKCVERAAAFKVASLSDGTSYDSNPIGHPAFHAYMQQMRGEVAQVSWSDAAWPDGPMPRRP